jgi:hypothetical protein
MQYLGLLFILSQLALGIWGLMLLAGFAWGNRWFALAAGPIVATTAIYAVECYHGLGPSLLGLEESSFVLSSALIALSAAAWEPAFLGERGRAILRGWRAEFAPRRVAGCLGILAGVFLYAFAWRYTDPNMTGGSEKDPDFSYICSYFSGSTIPVPDYWYYPYPSDHYYSFQHYAAALLGRVLHLDRGTTYNIAFCLLVGLGGLAFSGAVILACRRFWVRLLVIAGFLIGGTGATLFVHLTEKDVGPVSSMRYLGTSEHDKPPVGTWIRAYADKFAGKNEQGESLTMDLPGEPFSYSIYWGDYHATLSGYYLMGLSVMGMILWSRVRQMRYAAVVGAAVTWTVLCNPWNLPLQGLLTVAFVAYYLRDWKRLLPSVAMGAAAVWLMASVYLTAFTASGSGTGAVLRLVSMQQHAPPLMFLIFHFPTLVLIAMGFASGVPKGRWLGAFWLLLLLFTEFFYVESAYVGTAARVNSTLKWWPWVQAGTLLTLGPLVLERANHRWTRVTGFIVCLYPCFYAYDLYPFLRYRAGDYSGHLEASYFLTRDDRVRLLLDRLTVEKPGVVIERPDIQGGFTDCDIIPLFAGKQVWLGWAGHELLWRNFKEEIRRRFTALMMFYSGDMPDAGKWLSAQGIDYVLWYRSDDTAELWEKVNKSIGPGYEWFDLRIFPEKDNPPYGFWRRARPPAK